MATDFERHLVDHCAPTLAGIKVGNLFCCKTAPGEDIRAVIAGWNHLFLGKGVQVRLIRESPSCALVYVFRPALLSKLLARGDVARFLEGYGFSDCQGLESYIERLGSHIGSADCFPHEIGIFLGYPLQDVQGFIQNRGRHFSLCGFWKVYSEPQRAERLFKQYRKCFGVYKTLFENGRGILQLTVAA